MTPAVAFAIVPTPAPPAAALITTEEARALTDRIKRAAVRLWALLSEAHRRKAWRALGYASFAEYARAEFDMSQAHAYRLVNQAEVIRALEEAADSPVGEIPEGTARAIRPHLDDVRASIRERVTRGEEPTTAVRDAIEEVRHRREHGAGPQGRSNRLVHDTVEAARGMLKDSHLLADLSSLDAERLPDWVAALEQEIENLTRFTARLRNEMHRRHRLEAARGDATDFARRGRA